MSDARRLVGALGTVDRLLADDGPLALPRALHLLRPLAREIDRLHARGIVHGDVRPWRIVVTSGSTAADAGVALSPGVASDAARSVGPRSDGVDRPDGAPSGLAERDAAYRSPQLLAGEDARPSDDLYALGVVAYELLTGRLPFIVGTAASPARRPIPPGDVGVDLPDEVGRTLLAQVGAAPAGRFATAQQFVGELERAVSPDRASVRPASIADLMSPPLAPPTFRRARGGLAARQLALAELPDAARAPRHPQRPRRVRRNDYPELGLPGLWVAVIVVVLCSVYLLPGYYMLRRVLGGLFPDLFGPA